MLVERKYATLPRCEEIMCLPVRHDCVAFQLLGLFLQRSRRLLWMMLTYLQPVYPEISEESSDARWTLCQTHLDFCLSFLFPPTQSPCTVAGECSWKPAIFPNTEGEGGRRADSRALQQHLSQITKDTNEGIPLWHVSHHRKRKWVLLLAWMCVWHEDGPFLIWIQTRLAVYRNFPPANEQEGATKIGCHKSCL